MQERGAVTALTSGRPAFTVGESLAQRVGPVAGTAAVVIVLDQLTKWWALVALDDRVVEVVGSLRLNLVYNTGAAFGLGSRYAPLIALAAMGVVIVLLRTSRVLGGRWPRVAAGLVLGGALGNLSDRLFRVGEGFLGGAVIDFVDLQWWPVFNLADASLCVGAVLLALTARDEPARPTPEP